VTTLNIQQDPLLAAGVVNDDVALHDIELEQELLGACLIWPDAVDMATEKKIEPFHFFEPIHQEIFGWLYEMRAQGQRPSALLLNAKLGGLGRTDIAGKPLREYTARLAAEATTGVNVPDFCDLLLDFWKRREVMSVIDRCRLWLRAPQVDRSAAKIVSDVTEELFALGADGTTQASCIVNVGDASRASRQRLDEARAKGGEITGITYGLADLDRRTDGIHRGELVILGGRPGMSKSGIAAHVAYNAAARGYVVMLWSGEMSAEDLVDRIKTALAYKMSNRRVIPYDNLRSGRDLTESDLNLLRDAEDEIDKFRSNLEIVPISGLTIAQVKALARRIKQKKGRLDLIIMDYLQLLQPTDRYPGNRTAQITEISRECKVLAGELGSGVLALSQLNRETEKRDDKRAHLADLRESGSIEQDADVVIFPHRKAYYLEAAEPESGTDDHFKWQRELDECRHSLDIRVAKNRHGPTCAVKALCVIESNFFDNPAVRDTGGDPQRSERAA
jgi:replicative DNA helicase